MSTSLRAFLCLKHEMAALGGTGGGSIADASSGSATESWVAMDGAYSAVNAGTAGLSRSAAHEAG